MFFLLLMSNMLIIWTYTCCLQSDAIRINEICHNHKPKPIVFFWNDVFGEDAIFYSDFGESFVYRDDPKTGNQGGEGSATTTNNNHNKENEFHTISFPSLAKILSAPWKSITSRHFPLDKVFCKSRTLHRFRYVSHY